MNISDTRQGRTLGTSKKLRLYPLQNLLVPAPTTRKKSIQ